jgi:hypothetical protein
MKNKNAVQKFKAAHFAAGRSPSGGNAGGLPTPAEHYSFMAHPTEAEWANVKMYQEFQGTIFEAQLLRKLID